MLIFDIETGPLPDDKLAVFAPEFVPQPHPGKFDPAAVKCGNLKDESKRQEKIESCRLAHEAAVLQYDQDVANAKAAHWSNFTDKAALDPTTGQVLAIGFCAAESGKTAIEDGGGDEAAILTAFWRKYLACRQSQRKLVGCNILGFDLPFLVRRSWILGVDVPGTLRNGRYFDPLFIDIRDVWLCGQSWGNCQSSLDVMSKALGVGQKSGSGADFAKLWREDREAAKAYLLKDLELTTAVAGRLGIF